MNRLSYTERGDPRWKIAMPTFLIDGRDVCDWLGVTDRLHASVAGAGAVEPTDPYIYPQRTVLRRVSPGQTERQTLLSIHLGDVIGHFVSAKVEAFDDRIEWSSFDSCDGVKTPLLACGPFVFDKLQYVSVMSPLCRTGLLDAQSRWPAGLVHADAIKATWAAAM